MNDSVGPPRWLVYVMTTFGFGIMPMLWHWGGDFLATKPHVLENILSLPEGYIFAFLVSAATLSEAAFFDKWGRHPVRDAFRAVVIFISVVFAILALTLYAAMLQKGYPASLMVVQLLIAVVASAVNMVYMSLRLVFDAS